MIICKLLAAVLSFDDESVVNQNGGTACSAPNELKANTRCALPLHSPRIPSCGSDAMPCCLQEAHSQTVSAAVCGRPLLACGKAPHTGKTAPRVHWHEPSAGSSCIKLMCLDIAYVEAALL